MGRTIFKTSIEIVKTIINAGYIEKISWPDLAPYIREIAGSCPHTIKIYRKELVVSGLLKSENSFVFEITDKGKELALK